MNNVYGYTRVSTVKQGTQGVSLQEQRDAIERYAQASKLCIVEWFEETQTAAKKGRPIFTQMIRQLRKGDVQGVIIHKIDRSARNLKDWSDLGELIDGGVAVHFANESLDMDSRGGRLSADIQAVIASDFIRNLREETRKGFYGRLKQGIYPMQAPIGYLDQGGGKPKTLDPKNAPIVKHAFELYGTGTINTIDLSIKLNKMGLRNRNENVLKHKNISTMLRNPFYMGIMHIKKTGEMFEGKHEALITKTLFDRVQCIMDGRYPKRTSKHRFLFQKLIRCSDCHYYLIGEIQKGHTYYRCHTKGCPTSLREEMIEQAINNAFDGIHLTEEQFNIITEKLALSQNETKRQSQKQIEMLHMELNKLGDRENRLTDAYIDQVIDKESYEKRRNALLLDKKDIEAQVVQLDSDKDIIGKQIQRFLELVKSLQLTYGSGFREEKREILKNVSSNRSAYGKDVDIKLYPPYAEFKKFRIRECCDPYRSSSRTSNTNTFIKYLKKYYAKNQRSEDDNYA